MSAPRYRVADLVRQVVLQTTEDRRAQEDLENRLADQRASEHPSWDAVKSAGLDKRPFAAAGQV